jgi:hypothetical integral membrane protein (TIGR02206 family)
MLEFFAVEYEGAPFVFLGPAHVGALLAILALNLLLIRCRKAGPETRTRIRWGLAIVLWTAEASWHAWNLFGGIWRAQVMLPLNLCSILIWLSGLMLVRKDYRIYEFAYFLGIGAAIQYLATPDLGRYGFPHFRFFQAYLSHGLLLTAPLYLTVVEGLRPTWRSLLRVLIGANIYMIPIFFLNVAIDSNFLMLNAKPGTGSLLDILPPWPAYIPYMELIGLATCLLLYLPFIVTDARAARGRRAA